MIFDGTKEEFLESLFNRLQECGKNYEITDMSVSERTIDIVFSYGVNTFEIKMTEEIK